MQKRGETETLWVLVSIIGAMSIAYILANLGSQYGTGEIFLKSRVAKEIAFEIDALYSVPGDAYIINENPYDFSFEFKDNKVRVFQYYMEFFSTSFYHFVKSGEGEIDYKIEHPKQIVISKINNKIKITEEVPDFFRGITKKESDFKNKKILFYYDVDDKQSNEIIEDVIIKVLSKDNAFPNLYHSHEQDKIEGSEVIIGVYSKTGDVVSIYINKKSLKTQESISLANALSDKINKVIEGTEVIYLEEIDEDKKDILDNDKIAVYIGLPETEKINDVANAIYDSLKEYSK